jgi:hypothetical protein
MAAAGRTADPDPQDSLDQVLRQADEARKTEGRNGAMERPD